MITLDNKKIGNGAPVYYIAEVGATHTGLQSAKNLVDIAIIAGFDAVKFQIVESKKCPIPDELFNGHKCIDIWKQRELTQVQWKELKEYCNSKRIFSFTTITDVNQLDWFPSETYKIRSRDIGNFSLIKAVSEKCKVIQIDTGNASIQQISDAIDATGQADYIIHHCPSGYPAKPENEHLSKIREYKREFNCPIAYSAHSDNVYLYSMAIATGANMLEIPIKDMLESSIISPEAKYALKPKEACQTLCYLKQLEKCL